MKMLLWQLNRNRKWRQCGKSFFPWWNAVYIFTMYFTLRKMKVAFCNDCVDNSSRRWRWTFHLTVGYILTLVHALSQIEWGNHKMNEVTLCFWMYNSFLPWSQSDLTAKPHHKIEFCTHFETSYFPSRNECSPFKWILTDPFKCVIKLLIFHEKWSSFHFSVYSNSCVKFIRKKLENKRKLHLPKATFNKSELG